MISGVHLEVLLASGYALFLAGVAGVLEFLARHSHKRTQRYRNSGFVYFKELDQWECPAGRQLVRAETDFERGITIYRAPADVCNSCSLKLNCTDSHEGRRLESRMDAWFESELRRFHRGISLTLLALASLILVCEALRYGGPRELSVLLCLLLGMGIAQVNLWKSLVHTAGVSTPSTEGRGNHTTRRLAGG